MGWEGELLMLSLSATIMHAPWATERRSWVRNMKHQLRDIRMNVVEDHDRAGIWPTAQKAWRSARGSHHLVLQDDVELCDGFVQHATDAIKANPDAAISFFMFAGKAHTQAREAGLSWVIAEGHITAQALCLPSAWITPWLTWCRDRMRMDFRHDDVRLQLWLYEQGKPIWFTVPCLVEHLGDKTSIAGNHPPLARVAPWYEKQLAPVDWTRGLGDDRLHIKMKTKEQVFNANAKNFR